MAQFTINLVGEPLEELEEIVGDLQRENPNHPIKTAEQWLQNYCEKHLQARAKQQYESHAKKQTLGQLKATFGTLKDIRNG